MNAGFFQFQNHRTVCDRTKVVVFVRYFRLSKEGFIRVTVCLQEYYKLVTDKNRLEWGFIHSLSGEFGVSKFTTISTTCEIMSENEDSG
jgi:hypothetical protein